MHRLMTGKAERRIPDNFRSFQRCWTSQPHVLRFWETKFSSLAPAQSEAGGAAITARTDVAMIIRAHP